MLQCVNMAELSLLFYRSLQLELSVASAWMEKTVIYPIHAADYSSPQRCIASDYISPWSPKKEPGHVWSRASGEKQNRLWCGRSSVVSSAELARRQSLLQSNCALYLSRTDIFSLWKGLWLENYFIEVLNFNCVFHHVDIFVYYCNSIHNLI